MIENDGTPNRRIHTGFTKNMSVFRGDNAVFGCSPTVPAESTIASARNMLVATEKMVVFRAGMIVPIRDTTVVAADMTVPTQR
jgi:hypothetical protein